MGLSAMAPCSTDFREVPAAFPNHLAAPLPLRPELPRAAWWLLGLFVLCLVPRAVMAWKLASVCPDGVHYIQLAKALDQGNLREGLRDLRLNTYPVVLVALHRAGLDWEVGGKLWGVLISSLVVLPLYGWLRRQFDERVARLACLLYAVHTEFIVWSPELMRDPTFWFLAALSIYLSWRAVTEVRLLLFVAAGAVLALAAATRFEGLFFYLPLVGWSFWRWQALAQGRRRLVLGVLVGLAVFPALLAGINLTLLRGHSQWEWLRVHPLNNVLNWIGALAGSAPAPVPPPGAAPTVVGPAAPISLGRMVEVFVPTLVKAFTPLFGLAWLAGMWKWRRTALRADHRALGWVVLVLLAGIWVHLHASQSSCTRFFLPIVLMGSGFAALGMMAWSARLAAWAERKRLRQPMRCAAAAMPWALAAGIGLGVSLGSDCSLRAGQANLGRWIQRQFGPAPVLLGTAGCAEVVNHYAQGDCGSFTTDVDDGTIVALAARRQPHVVVLALTKRMAPERCRHLAERLSRLGYARMDAARLPPRCEKMVVLARRAPP